MDTKTRKICNDYYTCEKQTGQNFLVTLWYYKREERENVPDFFLLAPVTNTNLPLSLMYRNMAENFEPQ